MKLHAQHRLQYFQRVLFKEYCSPSREAAEQIRKYFQSSQCAVHWYGKLLTGIDADKVDRLPVLVTSLVDGDTKLLGSSQVAPGSGRAADAVCQLLKSWQCDHWYVLRYNSIKQWWNECSLHVS